MIINGQRLLELSPIKNMERTKKKEHGVSYGLSEAGYDIRIKQDIVFDLRSDGSFRCLVDGVIRGDRFCIASAIEEFTMPNSLVGVVHDKSTWARKGLSVFNTVIEPGWKGFLTLELVYHGDGPFRILAGSGIAQVLFSELYEENSYDGKYQNQENNPVPSIFEETHEK